MYPSDLTDAQWDQIKHHFEPRDRRGSSSKHEKKVIVNAILYALKTGTQWRYLPNDLPPWQTVYDHFSKWNKRGVWEQALDEVNQRHRKKKPARRVPVTGSSTRKA